MFEVNCPSARFNTHRQQYSRNMNNVDLITIKVNKDGLSAEVEMTVGEAEKLANDLMEWVREIKGEEAHT